MSYDRQKVAALEALLGLLCLVVSSVIDSAGFTAAWVMVSGFWFALAIFEAARG